jgi:hypothetical protein
MFIGCVKRNRWLVRERLDSYHKSPLTFGSWAVIKYPHSAIASPDMYLPIRPTTHDDVQKVSSCLPRSRRRSNENFNPQDIRCLFTNCLRDEDFCMEVYRRQDAIELTFVVNAILDKSQPIVQAFGKIGDRNKVSMFMTTREQNGVVAEYSAWPAVMDSPVPHDTNCRAPAV